MNKRKKILILIFVCALVLSAYGLNYVKNNYKAELLQNPLVHRMIPTYRSLRKLPDIVFMPWAAFAKSNLETYELTINPRNIEQMNLALPDSPFSSTMEDTNKLWVSGYFRTSGYEGSVKVRYRGNMASQWNAYQKSYLIKFPKNNLFNGMRELNLVIPSKRRYLAMSLNNYRAEKLGLIYPKESLVTLEVNGADTGVLLAFERWSQPWIEKMPISSLSTIYGAREGDMPYEERWKSWNMDDPIDKDPLYALQEIVNYASDEDFKRLVPLLIDIEDYYAWDVLRILAAGYHVDADTSFGSNNLVLIFDRSEGRFKPVPYNTVIYTPSFREMVSKTGVVGAPSYLFQRILSIPEFRERRDKVFNKYVETQKEDDLLFLDQWKNTYVREFLMDNAKNDNNFSFLKKIEENVVATEYHFTDPFNIIDIVYNPPVEIKEQLDLPKSFQYLNEAGNTPKEVAEKYVGIYERNGDLFIPAGRNMFTKTVIIPKGTSLTIAAGATLIMSENASFISYSPVQAVGTKLQPIKIISAQDNHSWGVFAVLNTEKSTSTFTYVELSNGSEDTINGAYISGTLALHNANSVLSNVRVTQAQGDDGLNVKGSYVEVTNSEFSNNSSDGVDIDYISADSIFSGNKLLDNGGDSIDISWSDITINDNTVINCDDKGISVGENSSPAIQNNTITNCAIAIAVKDSSKTYISGNTITDNTTAFSLYQKKSYFGGAHATATNNTLLRNDSLVYTDELSTIFLDENNISQE